jgi:SAM-dependent methyltransferase
LLTNIFYNSIKNWDNKTWLSSSRYVQIFNQFLIKHTRLSKSSKILDVGCGRGKILGNLSIKLKLKIKPLGIDLKNHKDRNKRFIFRKIDALTFFKKNKKTFDLILIKQTIHLLKIKEIKRLLYFCKNKLAPNGKIVIFFLDPVQNQIPTFPLMAKQLGISHSRDQKIIKLIFKLYPGCTTKKFIFNVRISKKKYLEMIENRYISTLLKFNTKEILKGINEINSKYKHLLKFKDKLQCIIIKK